MINIYVFWFVIGAEISVVKPSVINPEVIFNAFTAETPLTWFPNPG